MSEASTLRTRHLTDAERPFPCSPESLPVVLEPDGDRSVDALKRLVSENSEEIWRLFHENGAVLLRGFDVRTPAEYEAVIVALRGTSPISGYFMSEEGRDPIPGTSHVFSSSSFIKTGGDFPFGNIHTENYYSLDIPHLQSICCFREPMLGGETLLVHTARLYEELGADLRERLESEPCDAQLMPISLVCARYGISEETLEEFCRREGIEIRAAGDRKWLAVRKPSVLVHPTTGKPALQVSLSFELARFNGFALEEFLDDYGGLRWGVHRFGWKHQRAGRALSSLNHALVWLRYPKMMRRFLIGPALAPVKRLFVREQPAAPQLPVPDIRKFRDLLEPGEDELLARAIRKHAATFTWKRGDVMMFDNLQLQHAGLPGAGPRLIRVMMCNPAPIPQPVESGVQRVVLEDDHVTYHERLLRFAAESAGGRAAG
jgi:alpha-ketoglutarate-dependent taurine dioxygenase